MEAPARAVSINGDEERALRALVEAFGSNLSAEQILSAFCEAGKRAEVAGQILCDMLGTSSNVNGILNSNHDVSKVSSMPSMSHKLSQANGNPRSSKMKCPPASVGAVSSFLGKDYVRSKPLASGFRKVEKPMKLNAVLLPVTEIRGDSKVDATTKDDFMHKEMEDFLFQILGKGFKLDRNTIADTLSKCGYDMQKSLDKLFDHSASVMDRRINEVEDYGQKHGDSRTFSLPKKMQQQETSSNGDNRWVARNHLQKEVLNSLFTAPERYEELPVPIVMKCTKRSNIATPMVDEPLRNSRENITPEENTNESVEDETYKLLRKAVLEHRDTMKQYYKAAIDAFKRGDHDQARKLKEKGQFFQTKADEADEESSRMMFGNKDEEESSSVMTLDLHEFTPKEALRSLKLHISSLAGTQSYKYLKVIIECNNEDTSKGARRRLIMKLLERESIDRIEEEGADGMTIKIPLENLDAEQLSFAKK